MYLIFITKFLSLKRTPLQKVSLRTDVFQKLGELIITDLLKTLTSVRLLLKARPRNCSKYDTPMLPGVTMCDDRGDKRKQTISSKTYLSNNGIVLNVYKLD